MRLLPRYDVHDYRDPEVRRRQQLSNSYPVYQSSRSDSGGPWNGLKRIVGFLGAAAFVGFTAWNLVTIGGWMSDWYAKKRAERAAAARGAWWKRGHPRDWEENESMVAEEEE